MCYSGRIIQRGMPLSTSPAVRETILTLFDTLSPKHKQLARFILDNEDMVVFASANEIAERVDASAATVVRFCRALGYDQYAIWLDSGMSVARKQASLRRFVDGVMPAFS